MNITESRDEAFEAIAEMLRSNIKKTKIASKLSADYCVSDKTVYKWITKGSNALGTSSLTSSYKFSRISSFTGCDIINTFF